MENAVEALKIAAAVLLFVLALGLSMSSLSQANSAVTEITTMYDREAQFNNFIQPAKKIGDSFTRVVGIETIVPTLYRAYKENFEVYFKDALGKPIPIYYKTDPNGNIEKDKNTALPIEVNYIDLSKETFGSEGGRTAAQVAQDHLSMILAGKSIWESQYKNVNEELYNMLKADKYGQQFITTEYPDGFYNFLQGKKFKEDLGEYYQGQDSTKIKKRVITYTLIEE